MIYDNKYIKNIKVTIFLVGVKGLMSIVLVIFYNLYKHSFVIINNNKSLYR